MSLNETMNQLNHLLMSVSKDLTKVQRGNKAAAQRVRVGTIKLEKISKVFRKESVLAEKSGKFRKEAPPEKSQKEKEIVFTSFGMLFAHGRSGRSTSSKFYFPRSTALPLWNGNLPRRLRWKSPMPFRATGSVSS